MGAITAVLGFSTEFSSSVTGLFHARHGREMRDTGFYLFFKVFSRVTS